MTKPTQLWMQSLGLLVRTEFITPWGKCDLVGAALRKSSVRHRLRYGQTQAVSSLIRATLLLRIPDVETGKSVTLKTLAKEYASLIPEDLVIEHADRLIAQKFVRASRDNNLQKLNGWFPLHKRLMAIELKLTRVDEVMSQALNNLKFADESYVGLPKNVALRISAKPARWADFLEAGVGVLSITPQSCDVVIRSRRGLSKANEVVQFSCVEKFWRNHPKGS